MKGLVCNTGKSSLVHVMYRCPFCYAKNFMFWDICTDLVNQSGSTDVRILEVGQQVGRSLQRYTISYAWQNTFEVNRIQSGSVEGPHLFKLRNLCIEV